MSQPRPAVDDVATAEDRPETTFADEATATGRREAEYQDPAISDEYDDRARLGDTGTDYVEGRTDGPDDESDVARGQRTMAGDEEPARAPSDGNLAPGQGVNDPVAALWATDLVERYRSQWRDLQLTFVDDPKHAMSGAASLVDEAVVSLTNTLNAQKQALDGWQVTRGEDTEMMRVALRRYRDFLDRLLGL
jgi:hypothetical protein